MRRRSGSVLMQPFPRWPRAASFDHLVGAGEEGSREIDADGSCGLQVQRKLDLRWTFDRQFSRFLAPQYSVREHDRAGEVALLTWTVGHETALHRVGLKEGN